MKTKTNKNTEKALRLHWAKIRTRVLGLSASRTPYDEAAGFLGFKNKTLLRAIKLATAAIRPGEPTDTYWIETLAILEEALAAKENAPLGDFYGSSSEAARGIGDI